MDFFNRSIEVFQMFIMALGGGFCFMGMLSLLEAYSQDNPASKSQGIKQVIAGAGIALAGSILVPLLSSFFT